MKYIVAVAEGSRIFEFGPPAENRFVELWPFYLLNLLQFAYIEQIELLHHTIQHI